MEIDNWLRWLERIVLVLALGMAIAVFFNHFYDLDIIPELISLWQWGQSIFDSSGITLQALLFPALIWGAGIFFLKELCPVPTTWTRVIVSIILILLGLRYELWRFFSTLNLSEPLNGTLSIILFLAELLAFINTGAFFIHTIFTIDRTAEADKLSQAVIQGTYQPWVDVLVPTYNEPAQILRRTIIGCQAIDYPRKKVYLLDDLRRPQIRALARELGCFYIDRPDNSHAKAGNINHALQYISGELIVIFDADFVPCRNFLTRTVGFFQDRRVAMVQTPHYFFNEDPIAANLGLQTILTNEQALFFRYIQPSRDALNAVVCCGTCFVVRRSALDKIGGIPTESVTEDFFTSLKLQGLGDRIKYLNEILAAGMSPENISAYINQRLRWGRGTIQSMFCKTNLFTLPGLNIVQRFAHSLGLLYWFLSLCRLVFLVMPLAYILFELAPLRATIDGVLFFYLPYYICNILAFSWLSGGRRSVFWSDVYETIICFPMSRTIVDTLSNPFGKGFNVTPKGVAESHKIQVNWKLLRPLLILLVVSIAGIIMKIVNAPWSTVNPDSLAINIVWTVYNFALLQISILAAIDVPQRRHPRFEKSLECELKLVGASHELLLRGRTKDLSESGALFVFPEVMFAGELPVDGTFKITNQPEFAGVKFKVKLEWQRKQPTGEWLVGLEFLQLSQKQQRVLVEYLFCQPGQWKEMLVPEFITVRAMLASVFRMYSVAETR